MRSCMWRATRCRDPRMDRHRDLSELVLDRRPISRGPAATPRARAVAVTHDGDISPAIRQKDMLLAPVTYETFRHVVQFLQQAAADPRSVWPNQAQTPVIRTSKNSPIVKASEAAEEAIRHARECKPGSTRPAQYPPVRGWNGRARMWSTASWTGRPTARFSTVVRREGERLVTVNPLRHGQLPTRSTAKINTDLSFFFPCDPAAATSTKVFIYLFGYALPEEPGKTWRSRPSLKACGMLEISAREAAVARRQAPAGSESRCNRPDRAT